MIATCRRLRSLTYANRARALLGGPSSDADTTSGRRTRPAARELFAGSVDAVCAPTPFLLPTG